MNFTFLYLAFGSFAALGIVAHAQVPAFPGAEGFGSHSVGGRGGDVYTVTNLNASGAGSFADAVATAPVAGRTIVFAVSGHIRLPSGSGGGLTIAKDKITVAGQTAPGDGVCFWNNTMNLTGDDLVLRHLRWRYGKQAAGGDAVDIANSLRIIFDHCDHMFSTDENLSSFGTPPEYFTYQWSVNAWGLQTHSAGGLWDINHATAHHTLWANNHTRNPKCISPAVFDWVNNVVFGWDICFNMAPGSDPTSRLNIRGSTFSHGGSTGDAIYGGGINAAGANIFKVHIADSALDGNNNGVLDVSKSNHAMVSSGVLYDQVATPWPQTVNGVTGGTVIGAPATVDARLTAYKKVLSQAGATRMEIGARPLRDEITQLCVDRTAALQRGIISDPLELGLSTGTAFADLKSSPAPADTDGDGMPDYWESALGLSTTAANNNTVLSAGQIAASFFPVGTPVGYTQLEEYLHFMAVPHGVVGRNTVLSPSFIDVDLRKFTSGFTSSPVFTIANVSGGSFAQSGPGGALARFTPTPETPGRAGFRFTVTDADGSTWTQQCCLLVTQTPPPRPVVWKGDGVSNNWDTISLNWLSRTGSAAFVNGDAVTLDASGSNAPTIKLVGALSPVSVLVDTSVKSFTLQGTGSIGGGASVVKTGAGTLAISNTGTNAIASLAIDAGTVTTGAGATLGSAALSVANGTLNFGGDLSGPLSLSGTLNLNPNGSRSFNGAWDGSGTVNILTGSLLTFGGSMSVFDGDIHFGASTGSARLYGSLGSASVRWNFGTSSFTLLTRNGGSGFVLGELSGGANTTLTGASSTPTVTTYTVGALDTSSTFAGHITNNVGATALTKTGAGTLTLTGSSTHTGATLVSAGVLAMNGTFGASPVTVQSGARLSGTGAFGGTVATEAGGIVAPGGVSAGTLTTAALALTAPQLEFDLSSNPAGANDRIAVNGPVTLSGAQTFAFNLANGILGAGTYDLITSTGAITGPSASLVSNLPTGSRQTLSLERSADGVAPGWVRLVVTGANANLTWTGANGGVWDLQTTSAWSGASPATFFNGDTVRFDDSAASGAVLIAQAVAPRSLVVSNSAARPYTFTGGPITSATSLVKDGTGKLTLNVPQLTLTGGVTLNSATITLSNTAGLYRGMNVIGSMFPAGTTITAVGAGSVTVSQVASATNAAASLVFETRNTFTGGVILNAGELALTSNAAPVGGSISAPANPYGLGTGPITLNGGTLTMHGNVGGSGYLNVFYGALPNDLIVPAGANATLQNTVRGSSTVPFPSLTGRLTGAGTLNYVGNYYRAAVTGDWSAFTGTLNVKRPTSGVSDPRLQLAGESGLPLATVNLEQVRLEYTAVTPADGVTVPLGSLSGIGTSVISGAQNSTGPVTWRVGGLNANSTFAGSFTPYSGGGDIGLEKTGTGTWTLTGGGTVSAGITVEEGSLSYGDAATDTLNGTSAIFVESGGTLQLNSGATINGESLVVASGGTLRGRGTVNSDVSVAGAFNPVGGTLALGGDAFLAGTVLVNPPSGVISAAGTLELAGALDIVAAPGLAVGTTFTILTKTSAGTITGTFAGKPQGSVFAAGGYYWLISYIGGDGNDVTLTVATAQQNWRYTYFGTTANTGTAADAFDANGDGEVNLIEFATAQNPNASSRAPLALVKNGATLEFTYTRSLAALADGMTFTVEWSDTLAAGAWSSAGVTQQILSDNGTVQTVRASVAAGTVLRFMRLKVWK